MAVADEKLAEMWPDDCDLSPEDAEATDNLVSAIAQLTKSLGPLRTGWLLVQIGKKIAG